MAVITPTRSVEQRMLALARANEIRSARSRLKRDIAAGRVLVIDMLADPPEYVHTMKVFELLLAQPWHGRVKVGKLLGRVRVSSVKTVGDLSARQRWELVAALWAVATPLERARYEEGPAA